MMTRSLKTCLLLVACTYSLASHAQVFDNVKNRGALRCGVNTELAGFAKANSLGEYSGFDIDICRAVASALFNDSEAVEMIPLNSSQRFVALQAGELDILSRNTTWTLERNARYGDFVGTSFYDGQGFMVPKALEVASAMELDGAAVCTNTGTTTELNVADFFRANGMNYTVVAFEKADEVVAAYDSGRCDVYTTDRSGLAAQRTKLAKPDDHVVLPEIISKEPLGPLVRHGDSQWGDIARWTLNCMINAEEAGISSENIADMANSSDPNINRILGAEGDLGAKIGLGNDFCANVIASVGNYGETYNRNVGPDTPLQLERGVNALWSQGGLLYAAPQR